ncbi:MAG: hypothetical protein AAGE05_02180 [Pseudomonadota bacterium]
MNRSGLGLAAAAIAGLAANGVAAPMEQGDVMWMSVCGRPDMRVAIPLGNDGGPDPRDCAEACHAAMCRKLFNAAERGDARGAIV